MKVTIQEAQQWQRRYKKGESVRSISISTGRSPITVKAWLVKLGVSFREREEVASLAYRQNESVRAALAGQREDGHWNWKGGVTKRRDLQSKEYKQAREKRLKLAGGRCEKCHAPARHVHHVNGPSDHRLGSLRALCQACHSQEHENWPSDKKLLADWRRGMTVVQFADKYGVHPQTAAKYRHYARGLARGGIV